MSWYVPRLCSERFAGQVSYDDCGPCSAIMLARGHLGPVRTIACSQTEAYQFRRAGGAPLNGPTSNVQLEQGLRNRYGVAVSTVFGFLNVWAALTPGKGAVVFGQRARWPFGSHWRRWDPTFGGTGAHIAYVARLNANPEVWWMDPLAKLPYPGEWMPTSDLSVFMGGANATSGRTGLLATLATVVPSQPEEGMIYIAERDMTLKAGASIFQHPSDNSPLVGVTAAPAAIKTVGRPQAGAVFDTNWWGIRWVTAVPTGGTATERVVWVRSVDVS